MELMLVVAIVGILAAIAIPAYKDYTIRSQAVESLDLMSNITNLVSIHYSNTGMLPVNNGSLGLPPPRAFRATT